MSKVDHKKVFP